MMSKKTDKFIKEYKEKEGITIFIEDEELTPEELDEEMGEATDEKQRI